MIAVLLLCHVAMLEPGGSGQLAGKGHVAVTCAESKWEETVTCRGKDLIGHVGNVTVDV